MSRFVAVKRYEKMSLRKYVDMYLEKTLRRKMVAAVLPENLWIDQSMAISMAYEVSRYFSDRTHSYLHPEAWNVLVEDPSIFIELLII